MRVTLVVAFLLALAPGCRRQSTERPKARETPKRRAALPTPPREQHLTTATIGDPKTFNPLLVVDNASAAAIGDVFDGLLRLNPQTMAMEPMLAERWDRSAQGTVYTLHLRRDVRWHDGVPFTAADVAFTFDAIFDDRVPNSSRHTLLVDGQRIRTEVVDDSTIRLRTPRPFAPLLNALGLAILPQHILGSALADGTLAQQWGIDTPPRQIIGTGPYRMIRYVPGQVIEYTRNSDYWMKDDAGQALPHLGKRTLLIVPNQDILYLKFLAGQTDTHLPRPQEIADLRARGRQLQIAVHEIGLDTGSTFVSFNRNPRHYVHDGKRDPRLTWFTDLHFLRAIARAIDKRSMIRNCLNGYGEPAVADISPANRLFHNPTLSDYPYDLDAARRSLRAGGYLDRDGDGVIEDRAGNPVEFSLTTNSGNHVREKMCSILTRDWTKLGMKVNYRPLDFTALVEQIDHTFDWDAIVIGFTGTPEPNNGANLWRSSGNLHLWRPRQPAPATPWEAEIDALLDRGSRELDVRRRRRCYWRIQEIVHEQLAVIEMVRPRRFAAYKRILRHYQPTVWGLYRPELIQIGD
ncbi:MAG: ABC transporter substrate-binding protein [Candidatus Binatia bacterium]